MRNPSSTPKSSLSASLVLAVLMSSWMVAGAWAAPGEKAKVVIVAGTPSHGYGAHEFNAGSLLIQKLLQESMPSIDVVVHISTGTLATMASASWC